MSQPCSRALDKLPCTLESHRCRRPRLFTLVLLALLSTFISTTVLAGTICGVVRDVESGEPVERAGVFVHDPDDGYTGHHGATDAAGAFCIDGVPDGTYNLSVQVDDYQIAWLTDVVVDAASDVIVNAQLPAVWLWPPWPNPAVGRVNVRLSSRLAQPLSLTIYDATGKQIRGWQADAGPVDARTFIWDGRDRSGRQVPSGRYFVLLRSGDVSLTRPVVILR